MPFRILFILGVTAATAIGGAIYPFVGLLALEFLTFGRPQDDRPNVTALHIPMIVVISLAVGLLPRLAIYGPTLAAGLKRVWMMWLMYALLLVSAVFNGWTAFSQYRLYDFGTILFLCIATMTYVTTSKRLEYYVLMLLGCGLYVAERIIRNPSHIFEQIGNEHFERAAIAKGAGNFGNSNFLALLMVLTISLGLPLLGAFRKWWQRCALLALLGPAVYVFFRANSRGASLGLAASLFWMWLLSKQKLKATILALLVITIAALAAPASYWARVGTIIHYQEDASATDRLQLWNQAIDLAESNPIFGVGPDNFGLYSDSTPHDAYLQVASEVGVPAMLVYVAWLLSGMWAALRARQMSSRERGDNPFLNAASVGFFCCLVAIFVQGFTTGFAFREIVYGYVVFSFVAERLAQNLPGTQRQEVTVEPTRRTGLQRAYAPLS